MDQRTLIPLILLGVVAAPAAALAAPPWKKELPSNQKGREAFHGEKYDEALQHFEQAQKEGENADPDLEFNRGDALYQAGRYNEAEQAFSRASESDDGELRADAFYNRGLAQEALQNTPGALESYRRALLENPGHEPARQNLQRLLTAPPPPPQPQSGGQQQKQNDPQEQQKQDQQDQAKQDEQQNQQQPQAQSGEQPQQASKERAGGKDSGKLTEKEADDILRSAEQDARGDRLLPPTKPPRDYDPEKDW